MGYESPRGYPGNPGDPGDGQQRPQLPPGYVLPSLAQPDSYRVLTPLPVTAPDPDPDTAERRAITSLALGIVSLVSAATMLSFELSFHVCYANCLLAPIASIVGVTLAAWASTHAGAIVSPSRVSRSPASRLPSLHWRWCIR